MRACVRAWVDPVWMDWSTDRQTAVDGRTAGPSRPPDGRCAVGDDSGTLAVEEGSLLQDEETKKTATAKGGASSVHATHGKKYIHPVVH